MRHEAGSATVVAAMVIAAITLVAVGSASLGRIYVAHTVAVTAAEAGALAAAVATYPFAANRSPEEAAREIVTANSAGLVSCVCERDTSLRPRIAVVNVVVNVVVPVFGELAVPGSARAEFDPRAWLEG